MALILPHHLYNKILLLLMMVGTLPVNWEKLTISLPFYVVMEISNINVTVLRKLF